MKHTPTPWIWGVDSYERDAEQPNGFESPCGGTPLFDAKGDPVLVVYESHGGGMMPSQEDAAFIVTACNSFDAMREALEAVFKEIPLLTGEKDGKFHVELTLGQVHALKEALNLASPSHDKE